MSLVSSSDISMNGYFDGTRESDRTDLIQRARAAQSKARSHLADRHRQANWRRVFFAGALAAGVVAAVAPPAAYLLLGDPGTIMVSDQARALVWNRSAERLIPANGEVTVPADHAFQAVEVQGLGLLTAAVMDDPANFDRLWQGMAQHHDAVGSGLICGDATGCGEITPALASLLAAWAFTEAAERWERPDHWAMAHQLRYAIRQNLIADVGGTSVLLPAVEGYRRGDGAVVETATLALPAFALFAEVEPGGPWGKLYRDTRLLLHEWVTLRHRLPADHLFVSDNGGVDIAQGFAGTFTDRAALVGLYLAWNGSQTAQLREHFRQLWAGERGNLPPGAQIDAAEDLPAAIHVETRQISPESASPETREIWAMINRQAEMHTRYHRETPADRLAAAALRELGYVATANHRMADANF